MRGQRRRPSARGSRLVRHGDCHDVVTLRKSGRQGLRLRGGGHRKRQARAAVAICWKAIGRTTSPLTGLANCGFGGEAKAPTATLTVTRNSTAATREGREKRRGGRPPTTPHGGLSSIYRSPTGISAAPVSPTAGGAPRVRTTPLATTLTAHRGRVCRLRRAMKVRYRSSATSRVCGCFTGATSYSRQPRRYNQPRLLRSLS